MKYLLVRNRTNDHTLQIRAYDNAEKRKLGGEHIWEKEGLNFLFCTRKEVETEYGKDFGVYTPEEGHDSIVNIDPYASGVVDFEFYKSARSWTS